jgi:hypothetical protein
MIGFIVTLYTQLGTTGNYSPTDISTLYSSPLILNAIGLMPGGSVTKKKKTYKKWTYIARKQNSTSHRIAQ